MSDDERAIVMAKINPITAKNSVARFLQNNKAVARPVNGAVGEIEFYSSSGEYLGRQSTRSYIDRDKMNNLIKTTIIKRKFFSKFPRDIYEQEVVIEQNLKQVFGKNKEDGILLPTKVKSTKIILDKEANLKVERKLERELTTPLMEEVSPGGIKFYTIKDKPKYENRTVIQETEHGANRFKLSEKTKKAVEKSTGLTYDELIRMPLNESTELMKKRGTLKTPSKLKLWFADMYRKFGEKTGLLDKRYNIYTDID